MGDNELTALLFSGGMDSVALAHLRRPDLLITIDYGQIVAKSEIQAARYFADELKLPLTILNTDLRCTGAGSLAGTSTSKSSSHSEWWPFRNQLLISVAAAWGVREGITKLMIGTVRSDSSYADGTTSFITAMNALLKIQEGAIKLEAPAIEMNTLELIYASQMPVHLLPMCFSCTTSIYPCGKCRSCIKYIESMLVLEESSRI